MSQLSDPFNVNFISNGIEQMPNEQWTKTLSVGSISSPLKANWSSVACSSDGKFVMACVNGGQIYTSSNYGYDMVSDSSSILPASASWTGITISPDEKYAAACANGGGIYLATLNGTTWTWTRTNFPEAEWSCISFSGEGNAIGACIGGNGGNIYCSTNLGASWNNGNTNTPNIQSQIYYSIAYMGVDASQRFITSSNFGIIIWVNFYQGGIWDIETIYNPNPMVIFSAISSTIIYAEPSYGYDIYNKNPNYGCVNGGGIYKGENDGANWIKTSAPTANWSSIASSSNGQYVVACVNGGGIYCSLDYGNSWQEQVNGVSNLSWKCVATASNSSGSFLVGCAQNDYIYISPYFQGFQWISSQVYSVNWSNVASDSTGKNLIACMLWDNGSPNGGVGEIYISHDYGITWQSTNSNTDLKQKNWISVASNSDGKVLGAVINLGSAYISIDSGKTWSLQNLETTDIPNCRQISIDSSGKWAVVCSYYTNGYPNGNGRIYVKNDTSAAYGWSMQTPSFANSYLYSWTAIKICDNSYIYAAYWGVDPNDNYSAKECGIYKGTYDSQNNRILWGSNPIYTSSTAYYFNNITCSSDGGHIAAVSISENGIPSKVWISNDSGTTFSNPTLVQTPTTDANYGYQDITMDKTGQKIATVYYQPGDGNGYIYISCDYGVTWIKQEKNLPTTKNAWKSIASNDNMNKLVVCAFSSPYSDAGTTNGSRGIFTAFLSETSWTPQLNALPTRNCFTKLSSSSNGKYLAAAAANQTSDDPNTNNDYGGIWISTDYGTTWTKSDAGNFRWDAIASDNTGQYLVAGVWGGQIYTSSNYGLSWTIQSSSSGLPASANWDAISFSCNSDPTSASQYVYAQNYYVPNVSDGRVYYSTDRGITWKQANGAAAWSNGMGSSSDGKYAYYGINNDTENDPKGVYKTSEYGADSSFTSILGSSGNWNYVATDYTGQYVAAVKIDLSAGTSGTASNYYGIYLSTDYGQTWINGANPPIPLLIQSQNWRSVSLVNTTTKLLINALCANGLIYSGASTFASGVLGPWTWTLHSVTTNNGNLPASEWNDIKSSSDGTRLIICSTNGGIWSSDDSGVTWSQSTLSNTDYQIAITSSSTGQNLAAIVNNGPIYISSNYGLNWSSLVANGLPSYTSWYSIASSITGQYIVASTIVGDIYISDNYGKSWSKSKIGVKPTLSISRSGQYMVAAAFGGTIYGSSDFGSTWTQLTKTNGLPSLTENWSSISISNSGKYIAATINGGTIYGSSDFGSTWTQLTTNGLPSLTEMWSSISISGTGQNIVATINGGTIYSSSNFGSTWIQLTTTNGLPSLTENWSSISISGTGQNIVASINGGAIYSSSDFGSTWSLTNSVAANWNGIISSTSGQYLGAITLNNDKTDIYIYSNSMDIGNIWGSLINELQILITEHF